MKKPKRILICRPDKIGDVILMTPLIRELKRNYPGIFIVTLTHPNTKDILINNPNINDYICDNPKDKQNYRFWKQISTIRKFKFDTALILLPTERLAWMLFFAGIPKRIGVGIKLYQFLTFTRYVNRFKYIPLRHEADYCMDLGRKVGIESNSLDTEIFLNENEKKIIFEKIIKPLIEKYLSVKIKFLCIHPGNNHSAPNWTILKYCELISELLEDERIVVFITGSRDEMQYTSEIQKFNSLRIINLIGKLTLRELCTFISFMDVFISSSTGPMHIAAALKVPTVSLFCILTACSHELWGPKGNESRIITASESFCKNNCKNDPHNCILDGRIGIDIVLNEINNVILCSQEGSK